MFQFLSKKVKVAVHNGCFHPDDICAVAILALYLKKPIKIFRTRDPKVLEKMDYILDVGGEYNPEKRIFDHHEEGWDIKRDNGIKYAATGLVWKEFGEKITGSSEVAKRIEESIIQSIDAEDNGIELYKGNFEKVVPYTFGDYLFSFNQTWLEKDNSLKTFEFAVSEAKKMLIREIKRAKDSVKAISIVKDIYEKTEDKRLIILDDVYSWRKVIESYPEPLFVVHPRVNDNTWGVATVGKLNSKFERRKYFPESWSGKKDEELEKITGILGAVFCHTGRFVAVAKSKEAAINLAKIALEN